jgi:hypothetical protein
MWLRWDIHSAGELLICIGANIQFAGFSQPGIAPETQLVRTFLDLPSPCPSPLNRIFLEHATKPAPIERGDLQ